MGAPNIIICDATRKQKSAELKNFCTEIKIFFRVLEKDTLWTNKTEFYIGLIKETVYKNIQIVHNSIPFWDYCVEKKSRINNLLIKNLFQLHGSNIHTDI